jgi:diacylglycerol kinase (ATP)
MHATLIYNPNSGGAGQTRPELLIEALRSAGYTPSYKATRSENDLDPILAEARDLVVSAGGDGTLRAVATRLIGKPLGLALLPLGTANNIARTLGVEGSPEELIARLDRPVRLGFDVGLVSAPWGRDYFLEAFGYGLYADVLAAYDPEKGKSVLRSFNAITQILPGYSIHHPPVQVDGEDYSNGYLLFELLNTPAFGPRVKLAPQADPGDGWFDLVVVREDNRDSLLAYASSLLSEALPDLPSVEVQRTRCVEIEWPGDFPFHLDGEVRPWREPAPEDQEVTAPGHNPPAGTQTGGRVRVELLPKALEFWLPRPEAPETEAGPAQERYPSTELPPQ